MPTRAGSLTEVEGRLISAVREVRNIRIAADMVGVGYEQAMDVLNRPELRRLAAAHAWSRLYSELLPASVQTLDYLMTSEIVPAATRLGAARTVLEYTVGAQSPDRVSQGPDDFDSLTPEQRRALMDNLKAQKAKVINALASEVKPSTVFD